MSSDAQHESQSTWIQKQIEELLDRFEQAWQAGGPPPLLEDFLPAGGEDQAPAVPLPALLHELAPIDLEYRWRRCRRQTMLDDATQRPVVEPCDATMAPGFPLTPRVEDYLKRFPHLQADAELVAEEYRVRHRWGDRPAQQEFVDRFPHLAAELAEALALVDFEIQIEATDNGARSDTDIVLAGSGGVPKPAGEPAAEEKTTSSTQEHVEQPSSAMSPFERQVANVLRHGSSAGPQPMPARIGRYQPECELGRGNFGVVYRAYDPALDRKVAVKTPHAHRVQTEADFLEFQRKAQKAAKLSHPAIVPVFDVGRNEGVCYYVMEFIPGEPLRKLAEDRRFTPQETARLIADVADGVQEAHRVGLIHRDLKPHNILIDAKGRPYVTDFGLAIREEEQWILKGEVAGTALYMSPEQTRGETHRLDGRTDLWSLGVIMYELLTNRRPFKGDSVPAIFDEIQNREPKPLRQIDETIPAELEQICLRLLAKDITKRYSSCADLAEALRSFLASPVRGPRGLPPDDPEVVVVATPTPAPEPEQAALPRDGRTNNLPAPPDQFVGRADDIKRLNGWYADERITLITLLGPGGIGKTRLSLQFAREHLERQGGQCWWADLSDAKTAADVAHAVLHALGVPPRDGQPPEELVASVLEYRKAMLLVLDNFEQVVEHAEATVGLWRRRAPHVCFLVTSRSALGLGGERQFELEPLPAPASGGVVSLAQCQTFDSVQLFVLRAREVDAEFELSADTAAAVAEICAQLEGLPLAVELAAARIKILKPAQMLARFNEKLKILKSTRPDLPPRQRTIEGAIDWSYDLLEEWERTRLPASQRVSRRILSRSGGASDQPRRFPRRPLGAGRRAKPARQEPVARSRRGLRIAFQHVQRHPRVRQE